MAKLPAMARCLSHPNPRLCSFVALAKALYSTKARPPSHRARSPRSEVSLENARMLRLERENELWKLRCGGGLSSLPPSLPVVCRRGKGQHLLKNAHIVEAIVEKACIRSDDVVLEIGPGTGNLTLRLLEIAKKVIAVEVDPRMVEELQRRAQQTEFADKLEVIKGDIMRMELPKFDMCVANIPYKISSPLTFKLLNSIEKFRSAVLMLQREFARRLIATAGDPHFCRLSVNTQLLAKVDVLMEVSKANFSPPPKVDSSVVCITPRSSLLPVDRKEWDNFIRICFSRKNKTLGAIFRQKRVISILAGRKFGGLKDSDDESITGAHPNDDDDDGVDDCDNNNYDVIACNEELDVRNGDVIQSTEQILQLKERVIGTLLMGGFENRRSVKLSQDDFIQLLVSFNESGIRFA